MGSDGQQQGSSMAIKEEGSSGKGREGSEVRRGLRQRESSGVRQGLWGRKAAPWGAAEERMARSDGRDWQQMGAVAAIGRGASAQQQQEAEAALLCASAEGVADSSER
ncbi:hypothetical protein BHM03_00061877 [Ensete ventricosum]|nr:hypothetical protein BHM03_00061877 [Ensete ventricosum]